MKFSLKLFFLFVLLILLNSIFTRKVSERPERNKRDCDEAGGSWTSYGCYDGLKRLEGSADDVQNLLKMESLKYSRKIRRDAKRKRKQQRKNKI